MNDGEGPLGTLQIVIPMSGFGERFRRAGYTLPKPLICLEGKPIIAHVLDMFPGETKVWFVCNEEHLNHPDYQMYDTLKRLCPTGQVVGIPPHRLGPVHAVQAVAGQLNPDAPVIVNYCDFTCYWSWQAFKAFVTETRCAGAIAAYRGFHPHSLGSTNYAYMRVEDGWVQAIQEKQPFTDDRMSEYASSGTYYFATARKMCVAFDQARAQGLHTGGEYYVSMAYRPLLESGERVAVYPLQHFMQWGTPEDVAEYRRWSDAYRRLAAPDLAPAPALGTVVLPMAGFGQRFVDAGQQTPKPLIEVSGLPMVVQAVRDLPPADHYAFVLRAEMPGAEAISEQLTAAFPRSQVISLQGPTEGQACTVYAGLQALAATGEAQGPLTVGACDHGMLYDHEKLKGMLADPTVDVIVWGTRGHAHAERQPTMFSWVEEQGGNVNRISVKQALDSPATDALVLGVFTFKQPETLGAAIEQLVARGERVSREFYMDACINEALALGARVRLFTVDHYLNWGTPQELATFQYWQACFHKWSGHPYTLDLDIDVPCSERERLRRAAEAPYHPD
jgi:NDP-sugar pyrophosphorylase family protein